MRDHFEDKFPLWARAIVIYCKDTQVRSTALQIETADYSEDTNDGKHEYAPVNCSQLIEILINAH